jgi:peptidoglycan/LPS O-acetylase OafA/YrhL
MSADLDVRSRQSDAQSAGVLRRLLRTAHVPADLKGNSLDFLRLALAFGVIVSHCYPIGGLPIEGIGKSLRVTAWGEVAVGGFFFLSGILITRSYLTCSSVSRYLWHRCLRILPGFWVCLLTTALVFGPAAALMERHTLTDYFVAGAGGPLTYVTRNSLLWIGQYGINDLLTAVPFPHAFNGSLWTLYSEFVCYIVMAILGATLILRRATLLVVGVAPILLILYASHYGLHRFPLDFLFYTVLHGIDAYLVQAAYFFVGAATFLYRDRVPLNIVLFTIALIATAFGTSTAAAPFVLPFTFSYVLLWLAFRLPIRNAARYGDFSYGLYIYAFPVQQLLALLAIPGWGFLPYLLLSLVTTLLFAIASWHLVERRCLAFKHATLHTRDRAGRISFAISR